VGERSGHGGVRPRLCPPEASGVGRSLHLRQLPHSAPASRGPRSPLRRPARVFLAAAALWAGSLGAAELAGVVLPDEQVVAGRTLVLNGIGLREATFLRIDVYVAGLYLEEKTADADAVLASAGAKRLVIAMLRRVTRGHIASAWRAGMEKNAGAELPALGDRMALLEHHLTDLAAGDRIVLTEVPGRGLTLEVGGVEKTTIPGDDFARAFWRIWLGRSPASRRLKRALLGSG
jgi:hypothetical protein